jgi:hypothetical protein
LAIASSAIVALSVSVPRCVALTVAVVSSPASALVGLAIPVAVVANPSICSVGPHISVSSVIAPLATVGIGMATARIRREVALAHILARRYVMSVPTVLMLAAPIPSDMPVPSPGTIVVAHIDVGLVIPYRWRVMVVGPKPVLIPRPG